MTTIFNQILNTPIQNILLTLVLILVGLLTLIVWQRGDL